MNTLKFWKHPSVRETDIQLLLTLYSNIQFHEYNISRVDRGKKNIFLFCWKSTSHTNNFFNLIKELNDLGFYFLADYSTEANENINEEHIIFLNKLVDGGIDLNRFYLVSNNINNNKIQYGPHLINHIHFPHFLLSTPVEMKKFDTELFEYKSIQPTNDFFCMGDDKNSHFIDFVNRLSERELLPYTDLSSNVDNINVKSYFDSKVSIIVETNVGDLPTHLTEKTIKPIYLERPFVVYGTKEHLNWLRHLRFATFQDFINEYDCTDIDSVIDAAIRLTFIVNRDDVVSSCNWNKEIISNQDELNRVLMSHFLDRLI